MATTATARERAKSERTDALLRAAAKLFAERGYAGVSLEDIGAQTGVSGPAVYRHFPGKQALLGAVLTKVSADLLAGSAAETASSDPEVRMRALIAFQVHFALQEADVIQVHDRDFVHLADADRDEVIRLQRAYVDHWIAALRPLLPVEDEELRLRVQACFGLINSTPHSTRARSRSAARTSEVLASMAYAALRAGTI